MVNKLVSKNMPTDNRNLRNTLISNFEIIQSYLDKLDTDELGVGDLKKKFDDISNKINIYETNMQAIVNILSDYDVPIAIVDGKVVETKEGE
ncbi:hypothetical protein [Lactiplantibacillus plantarum]|uniref:hypothetical protein n=1 Tax=Lactiplantibacillus plantarum TaxID=1590 RepID=UPI0029A737D9|nr:hypothetical protein [Lactiplantibacillus plantarum]MDX3785529.1 hypothetical protein [Lactiplantibacillus plantarum]MDX3811401.1 hypothetical protein [Lactiplantibacillus plantarum]MDX3856407.1 hypothetical protein [Lactiplantibacillus plantarum]